MNETSTIDMARCIADCLACHRVCLAAAMNHCLEAGGEHVAPLHFRRMISCAEICRTTAAFMLSSAPSYEIVCGACAEICERCADDCDVVGEMDDCADACRRCAESCRHMSHSIRVLAVQ